MKYRKIIPTLLLVGSLGCIEQGSDPDSLEGVRLGRFYSKDIQEIIHVFGQELAPWYKNEPVFELYNSQNIHRWIFPPGFPANIAVYRMHFTPEFWFRLPETMGDGKTLKELLNEERKNLYLELWEVGDELGLEGTTFELGQVVKVRMVANSAAVDGDLEVVYANFLELLSHSGDRNMKDALNRLKQGLAFRNVSITPVRGNSIWLSAGIDNGLFEVGVSIEWRGDKNNHTIMGVK